MNNAEFKLPRIKSIEVNPEFYVDFLKCAKALQLYDEKFSEKEQCGGFFAFKQLVLTKDLMPAEWIKEFDGTVDRIYGNPPGAYLLGHIHAKIRHSTVKVAHSLRKKYKIQ